MRNTLVYVHIIEWSIKKIIHFKELDVESNILCCLIYVI